MKLFVIDELLTIIRVDPKSPIPAWAFEGTFFSLTKTSEELSIVCESKYVPTHFQHESNWRAIKIAGPLDFSLTGVLVSILSPLAEAQISIFAISTFDTDYILIRENNLVSALDVLSKAGHEI